MNSEELFGEVIYRYTRAQAIADGVLVDLSQMDAIRRQWTYPFACTSAVWTTLEHGAKGEGRGIERVVHEMSTLARIAAQPRRNANPQEIRFAMALAGAYVALKLHVGPGDQGEPVLTLMLPDED